MRAVLVALSLTISTISFGVSAPAAHANSLVTIAQESFDYAPGSLEGADGGSGWLGAWGYPQGGDSPLGVSATGLSYPGLPGEGGATQYRGVRPINGSGRDVQRVESGVVYIRFLTRLSGGFSNGAPTFRLFDTAESNNTLLIGSNNTGNNASLITTELTPRVADSGVVINDNQTHLLMARIDYQSATVDLWVDPDLASFDYSSPPAPDSSLASYAPAFDRIFIFNRFSGAFDEISIMRLEGPAPQSGNRASETYESLTLVTPEGVACKSRFITGARGEWMTLPNSEQCAVIDDSDRRILGWATRPNFSTVIASRQVDNGWGAYETFNDDGQLTGVFIPTGRATFLSSSNTLFLVVGN